MMPPASPAAFLALLLAAPAAERSVEHHRKTLVASPDPAVRREAAAAIGEANSKEAVAALVDGCRAVDERIVRLLPEKAKALEELETFGLSRKLKPASPAAGGGLVIDRAQYDQYQALLQRAQDVETRIMAEEEVRRAVIAALAAMTDEAAVARMLAEMKASRLWGVRSALCEAAARVPGDAVPPAIADRLARDSDARVRGAAAAALGARDPAVGPALLLPGLKDTDWRVRVETLKALGLLRRREGLDALAEALRTEEGRLRAEARDALVRATGVDKGDSPDAWKIWLQSQPDPLPPPDSPDPSAPVADPALAPNVTVAKLYGIPVQSKRVVFLLDRSGSMSEPAAYQGEADETAVVKSGRGLPPIPPRPAGGRKWDVATWELSRVILRLPDETAFNIICFDHEHVAWQRSLTQATPAAKKSALDFLNAIKPAGGTNLYDPLERALGAGAVLPPPKAGPDDVDTVYIVTDGLPNLGQIPDPRTILDKVRALNRHRRIAIHTVWVGIAPGTVRPPPPPPPPATGLDPNPPPPPPPTITPEQEREVGELFLRLLAEQNGGRFVSR